MPASDLPLNLRMLLDNIVDNNKLRSWQVYSEKDGMTVKLRFNSTTEVQQGEAQMGTVDHISYVKKSPSQQRRDNSRAQQHGTMTTRSQKARNDAGSSSIERPRAMKDISVSADPPIQSPMSVASDFDPDPSTPEFMPQSTPQSLGRCDSQVALNQVGHGSTDRNINTHMEYTTTQETVSADSISSLVDSESDDDELEKTLSCTDYRCSYGPCRTSKCDLSLTDDLLECTYPDCFGILCVNCKLKGGHKSHTRWLKLMTHEEYMNYK